MELRPRIPGRNRPSEFWYDRGQEPGYGVEKVCPGRLLSLSSFVMYEESLLERIRHLEKKTETGSPRDVSQGVRSIIDHLQRMLNTRQGSVLIADDYGMPDFTNFPDDDLKATADDVERIISHMIEKYEPRLQKVRVYFESKSGDMFDLRFKLEAEMISSSEQGKSVPVVFETVVTSEGKVRVES